jgi:ubiquinone/menaquinone biosynthesis C-methylase UbiE
VTSPKRRRYDLVRRLGIEPTIAARLKATLGSAVDAAAARSPGDVTVLDAGCGRTSPLIRFRDRIDRFVGVDIHAPEAPLPYLDEFATVDLCADGTSFPEDSFEVVLSNFTVEHFADPPTALANLYRWLRPGGTLVITTVNRRHPFVNAYLSVPDGARHRIQPLIKATAADAHPLVGVCNDPETIAEALGGAGYEQIRIETVGNLARAWGRRLPTFAIGLAGDVIAQGSPSRRSTILASAMKPAGVSGG